MTTLDELYLALDRFTAERGWAPFHTPRNLATSIAIEAGELLELVQWGELQLDDDARLAAATDEIADVLIYALTFARAIGVDPLTAIEAKMAKNAVKYPAGCGRIAGGVRVDGGAGAAGADGAASASGGEGMSGREGGASKPTDLHPEETLS